MMSIYRLPHGQYGYSGHVINLPQDISGFVNSLPRHPSDLDIILIKNPDTSQAHRDFRVRKTVVLQALNFLKANNVYFSNITINLENLSLLPDDSTISNQHMFTVEPDSPFSASEQSETPNDPEHITSTFIPGSYHSITEEEHIRRSLEESSSTSSVPWPTRDNNTINEFSTEGYFSCAFPTLFPTGSADFLAPRINKVTIGNYLKHLLLYDDGRFAKHSRFRYFALNTEMRWRAIETGRIYVRQNPNDDHLTIDELRDMVGTEAETFSNRVLHYAASLRGTRQYWMRQRSRLISMVDTLGMPTIFFTHSAADFHWPELTHLFDGSESDNFNQRNSVADNPALADWLFYYRVQKFVDLFYIDILQCKDFWLRFEWQHRGSPHVHGLAWLTNAPNVEEIMQSSNNTRKEELITFIDSLVSTTNPAVLSDGSNLENIPVPVVNPHVCARLYSQIEDYQQDLIELIATCQRHTRCSTSYCLRTKEGQQVCRFGYPKPMQQQTTITNDNDETELLTSRNDGLLNSFNPIQLSAWRANVDMKYIVSRHRVIEYCAKYATKCEPRSQPMRQIFQKIMDSLKSGNTSLTVVQKLLINSVGERDYSAQETCHLLMQLPMFKASRDFIVLSLDGSRVVQQNLTDGELATSPSILDCYLTRPSTQPFENMTLLCFAKGYSMKNNHVMNLPSEERKLL